MSDRKSLTTLVCGPIMPNSAARHTMQLRHLEGAQRVVKACVDHPTNHAGKASKPADSNPSAEEAKAAGPSPSDYSYSLHGNSARKPCAIISCYGSRSTPLPTTDFRSISGKHSVV